MTTLRLMIELKLISQEADSVTCVLLHGAGEVDANQCDLAFVRLRKPTLFERNILPKETILCPTRGKHVLIPIGSDKRNKLAGDGDDTGEPWQCLRLQSPEWFRRKARQFRCV
jgi:hypothetical protein